MKKNSLHNKQETGFKTPQDYFNAFEDDLKIKIATEQFPKKAGFNTPEGYFDSIDAKNLIPQNEKGKVISLLSWKSVSLVASIAAVLIILFNLKNTNDNLNFETLETAQIENYLIDEQVDLEELAMMLPEETLTLYTFLELEQENVEDYLMENASIENLIIE